LVKGVGWRPFRVGMLYNAAMRLGGRLPSIIDDYCGGSVGFFYIPSNCGNTGPM
jgi:hypothetical protein